MEYNEYLDMLREQYKLAVLLADVTADEGLPFCAKARLELLDELTKEELTMLTVEAIQIAELFDLNGTSLQYMFIAAMRYRGLMPDITEKPSDLSFQSPEDIATVEDYDAGWETFKDVLRVLFRLIIELKEPYSDEGVYTSPDDIAQAFSEHADYTEKHLVPITNEISRDVFGPDFDMDKLLEDFH